MAVASMAGAQNVEKHSFDNFNVHVFTSPEAMGDISILVEGERELVMVEPQSFYKSIEEFNGYIAKLGKPLKYIVASYHAGGLASYNPKSIYMVEPMVAFMQSEMAQGMLKKFDGAFGGAMDTRMVKPRRTIPATSIQKWAGVEFSFTAGAASDFPASSINIGGKVFYTHFAPNMMHPSPMQLNSPKAVDATLAELIKAKHSGCEIFVGSHGSVASREDVEFMVGYLTKVKELISSSATSDIFAQRLIVAYPSLAGIESVSALSRRLYPNEVVSDDEAAVRSRVNDYFNMVSNLDETIAKGLWAESENISIITPRSHFIGFDAIMNDFLKRTFSKMKYRKLSSFSEAVSIYGDMASVQLYWKFDTIDADDKEHQTRGRESLIFSKTDGEWRLVHVHYSRMPQ